MIRPQAVAAFFRGRWLGQRTTARVQDEQDTAAHLLRCGVPRPRRGGVVRQRLPAIGLRCLASNRPPVNEAPQGRARDRRRLLHRHGQRLGLGCWTQKGPGPVHIQNKINYLGALRSV